MNVKDFITDFFTTTDSAITIPDHEYETWYYPFSLPNYKLYVYSNSTKYTDYQSKMNTYILKEKDNHYFIYILCAGLEKEDIELSYKRIENVKYLIVSFKKENEFNKEKDIVIPLPDKIDQKTLKASLKNGILTITIDRQSDSYEKINITIE